MDAYRAQLQFFDPDITTLLAERSVARPKASR